MTVKLYEQDAYMKEFTATVASCEETKGGYAVVLNQTAFFPEGGGQAPDKGTLNGVEVLDVQINGEIIVHTVVSPLKVGSEVTGVLDFETRFDRMQNHTGEHLVSGVIHKLFGYNNIGFHMNDQLVTLDVDGALNGDQIALVEQTVNNALYENRKVTPWFPTSEELKNYDYRSKLDLTDGVRLVEIDGYDVCACCAPHVASTGEIGVIKIIDFYPNKQGTRVEMLCGKRAFADYCSLHQNNKEIMGMLSSKRMETPAKVKQEQDALQALRAEYKNLAQTLALAQLQSKTAGENVYGFTPNVSYDELRYCVNRLQETCNGICALFSVDEQGESIYIVASTTCNIQAFVKEMNGDLQGRGGGKPNYAQGKVSAPKSEIETWLGEKLG